MRATPENLSNLASDKKAETKKYFVKLKKKAPKQLDVLMQQLHDEEFNKIDCLTCANCCKTTSPIFTDKDIARIAKHLRLKEHQFIEKY
ncbi:MAG: YkgJ family cysteine cluster protein, partial [Flavobacteriaceae bacterium]|nr:YkgJ family cysteine cluster protein [Flavobacteriaceae bacterium]